MIDFNNLYQRPEFAPWTTHFKAAICQRTNPKRHGDLPQWLTTLGTLPTLKADYKKLDSDTITIGNRQSVSNDDYQQLNKALRQLSPWRKGPFNLFGVFIDTEWRSDWKWQRLAPHITCLAGRKILDVGCGNGYHCWRMLGLGARYVMGIDPSMRFLVQHLAINKYAQNNNFDLLPLGIEDMPTDMALFDTAFSMGVLYHRRDPLKHLIELKSLLASGGELVLETLIVDHAENGVLETGQRYAQMRNVWSIMTVDKIEFLLHQAGFQQIRCVDENTTSVSEQRSTQWMQFHSLADFLDPKDHSKTVEGYPAPKRGTFIANKPKV